MLVARTVSRTVSRTLSPLDKIWVKMMEIPWKDYFGIIIFSFLTARASFLGELHPFGTSFLAAVCLSKPKLCRVTAVGVIFGAVVCLQGWQITGYILCTILIYAFMTHYREKISNWLVVPGLVCAVHLLVRGSITAYLGNETYQWVGIVFEGLFAAVLTLVSLTGIKAWPRIIEDTSVSFEERTSLALLVLGGLLGLSNISLWGISIQSVISRLLVLWGALLAGPGGGAAVGVAAGLMPSIQGFLNTGPIAFYALAGLLGGIFHGFHRLGVIVGFTLANLLLSLFFSGQDILLNSILETGIAVVLFTIIKVPSIAGEEVEENKQMEIIYDGNELLLADKLKKLSRIFYDLEYTFFSGEKVEKENDELNIMFNKVSSQVCQGCSLYRICWEQEFYKTYRGILEACTKVEDVGFVNENDFGNDLKRRCRRLRELSVTLSSHLEVLQLIDSYDKQLEGCSRLVKNQLRGIGQIIDDFSDELKNQIIRDKDMEGILKEKLEKKGIVFETFAVIDDVNKEKEIIITQKRCKERNWCKSIVAPNISQAMGKTYIVQKCDCSLRKKDNICSYTLVPSRSLKILVGKAQCSKKGNDVSGDVCSAITLPDSRFALVISDGMGTGEKAYAESSAAVELLEKILLAGFSFETAVKTTNSALFLRNGKENFATLDLVIVNQINGQTDFIKIGGAPTLIYTEKGIRVINALTPPAGILDNIELQTYRQILVPNNIIIMMSDGVWEAIQNAGGPDGWLEDLLNKIDLSDPQQIASYILFLAQKACNNKINDDMCVQVARIGQQDIA